MPHCNSFEIGSVWARRLPTTTDELTLLACLITPRSEPAADNDQVGGNPIFNIYNFKMYATIFHQQVSFCENAPHTTNRLSTL